jgi:WXG100 family type VII secretion target
VADNILVGADKLRAVATQLDHLREQAQGTLQNYLGASHDIHGGGGWQGMAAMANVNTAEEIHNAQMKLNTQWGELIQALRAAADHYQTQEEAARAAVQNVAQSM